MSHFETLFVALILGSVLAVLKGLRVRARGIPFKPGIPPRTKLRFAAFFTVLFAFFLPFFWWRTTVGYVFGILAGIATVVIWTGATGHVLDGVLPVESYIIIIPGFVFTLLLIGSSVLAWREGWPRAVGNCRSVGAETESGRRSRVSSFSGCSEIGLK